jgi:fructose-1,6-bisphosphatase I
MTEIIKAIEKCAIRITDAIKYEDTSKADTLNESGDIQVKLDVISDDIIEEEFSKIRNIKEIISEEKDKAQILNENGKYLIAYDPLDGSSLIDVNLSVGSIFAIYENSFDGQNIVAAVYVVYGPRVEMVVARDNVEMFKLNEDTKEFIFQMEMNLNEKGKILAPGGTQKCWYPHHKKMIDDLFMEGYRLRYSGGMVPDLHQILLKGGGLFAYPGATDKPNGKLRILFEVYPFAFIYNKAGGLAINGEKDLLHVTPSHSHDTAPCFFGSNYEIQRVLEVYGKEKN